MTGRQGEGRQGEGRLGEGRKCDLEFGIWFLGFGISKFERAAIEH